MKLFARILEVRVALAFFKKMSWDHFQGGEIVPWWLGYAFPSNRLYNVWFVLVPFNWPVRWIHSLWAAYCWSKNNGKSRWVPVSWADEKSAQSYERGAAFGKLVAGAIDSLLGDCWDMAHSYAVMMDQPGPNRLAGVRIGDQLRVRIDAARKSLAKSSGQMVFRAADEKNEPPNPPPVDGSNDSGLSL